MANSYDTYIGRSETRSDVVTRPALSRFKATLNMPDQGEFVPDGFHWCLCLPDKATQDLGADGHPPLGDFLPVLAFPRRMWAASNVEFLSPLMPGMAVTRRTHIHNIEHKSGRSGDLIFVTLNHLTATENVDLIRETQTIVYRDHPVEAVPLPLDNDSVDLGDWDWHETITPDAALLFRYSALTFNAHRIHYDQAYAREIELYPDLVVHGPLTATLLLKLCADRLGDNALSYFSFAAKAPLYVGQMLHLTGRKEGEKIRLCVFGADGCVAVEAHATLR